MRTFLWVVLFLDQLFLLLIGAVNLNQYELSEFVLREQFGGRSDVYSKLRRSLNKRLPKVKRLQQLELTFAFAVGAVLFSQLNLPVVGLLYCLGSTLLIVLLQRTRAIKKIGAALFERSIDLVIKVVDALKAVWWLIGVPSKKATSQISSQEELLDILRRLPSTVVNPVERQRLENIMLAENKTVKDIMTNKKRVILVSPSATLGPVVLSDLQKTGHGYFPVATPKGEVEGVLNLGDVADIHEAKQRSTVRELMSDQMSWVNSGSTIYDLIHVFLRDKQYLVLVRGDDQEFAGVVTIADVMKHLLAITKED
jgi:CBS domain containing-hemolysin-like protein